MCLCRLGVLFRVYVQTVTRGVIGSDLFTKWGCAIYLLRLCKGIHCPPVPFSRVICRFQLLFLLGCVLDGGVEKCGAMWLCSYFVLNLSLRSEVRDDSGW